MIDGPRNGTADRPGLLGSEFFPDEVVAASAVVAAGPPGGEGIQQILTELRHDLDAILVPADDHGPPLLRSPDTLPVAAMLQVIIAR